MAVDHRLNPRPGGAQTHAGRPDSSAALRLFCRDARHRQADRRWARGVSRVVRVGAQRGARPGETSRLDQHRRKRQAAAGDVRVDEQPPRPAQHLLPPRRAPPRHRGTGARADETRLQWRLRRSRLLHPRMLRPQVRHPPARRAGEEQYRQVHGSAGPDLARGQGGWPGAVGRSKRRLGLELAACRCPDVGSRHL